MIETYLKNKIKTSKGNEKIINAGFLHGLWKLKNYPNQISNGELSRRIEKSLEKSGIFCKIKAEIGPDSIKISNVI